jgi:uncharacterized protein YozE (UPF0346 family)
VPKGPLTFHQWLLSQRDRDDPIGDLACGVEGDKTFPQSANYQEIRSHLLDNCHARAGALDAFNEAYIEYLDSRLKVCGQKLTKEVR